MAGFHLHFSLKTYYRIFFFHSSPWNITHLSRARSNASKIAAIIGNPKNSPLLTAQPGANQKSSFARHHSQPVRGDLSVTCHLPFSLRCFSLWIHLFFSTTFRIFSFEAFLLHLHTCVWTILCNLTVHLIIWSVPSKTLNPFFFFLTTLNYLIDLMKELSPNGFNSCQWWLALCLRKIYLFSKLYFLFLQCLLFLLVLKWSQSSFWGMGFSWIPEQLFAPDYIIDSNCLRGQQEFSYFYISA